MFPNRFVNFLTGTLCVITAMAWHPVSTASTRSNVNAWLASHSLVPHDGFMVSRVHEIFKDVKRASDSAVFPTQLYIIQSNSIPWAIALEDKNIILTSGAIDVIYSSEDSLHKKDARMAFVLGHELKHVIENDFSHQQAYNSFSQGNLSDLVASSQQRANSRKTLELLADEEGLINASLAGYDISAIFTGIGDADNFLEYWSKQTNTFSSNQHHTPSERIAYLKESYQSIDNLVEFFKYGVRLTHFGDHANAKVLLEDFYKVYESNRVLTNRGYVHLQLAREAMPVEMAYRYWFPDLLDLDSGFPVTASRAVNATLPLEAHTQLNQAVAVLKKALEFSANDIATRMNLISAYLFLGEYSSARAVMDNIPDWSTAPELHGLDAIVVMQDRRLKNPWDTFTLDILQRRVSEPDAPLNLIYNYARILQDNDREQQAQAQWQRLAQHLSHLPKPYQVMVCRQLADKAACAKKINSYAVKQLPWRLEIHPGDSINSRQVRSLLKAWNTKPVRSVSGIDATIYPDGEGNSLLVLDGQVKLVTIRQHGFNFVEDLKATFGEPVHIMQSGTDQIWSYSPHWSALVADNEVREIWVSQ